MSTTTTHRGIDRSSALRFFDEFDAAFASFDGEVVARRFAAPYLACRADGSSEVFTDAGAIGHYFGSVVGSYRAMGVRSCAHRDLEMADVGGRHALATVTWDLRDREGSTVISWRESYVLVRVDDRLRIRASIDFADG